MLIALVLDVDLYTIGVIRLLIQTVVVADPLCKAIVAFGLIVIVPVVVAVIQLPAVAMVYVKVPDCVAVPLIVKRFVLVSKTGVNPAGKPPATILIILALEVDSYTIGVIAVLTQTVVVEDPPINAMVASGLIVIDAV